MVTGAETWERKERERVAALEAAARRVHVADYKFKWVSIHPDGDDGGYLTVQDAIVEGYETVWACEPQPWPVFDAEGIVRAHTEDGYCEDAHDFFDISALQTLLDAWLAAQGKSPFFVADSTTIVVLREART